MENLIQIPKIKRKLKNSNHNCNLNIYLILDAVNNNVMRFDLSYIRDIVGKDKAWNGADCSDDWSDLGNEIFGQGERGMALVPHPARLDPFFTTGREGHF